MKLIAVALTEDCLTVSDSRGKSVLDCADTDITKIPTDSKSKYNVLKLTRCSKLHLVKEDFEGWTNLYELDLSEISFGVQRGQVPLNIFADMKIEVFQFSDAGLTDQESWLWPATLKSLTVSGNHYTRIDLSRCHHIQKLWAANNSLNEFPIFDKTTRSIQTIHVHKNPMANLTVNDLAPHCSLSSFELIPTPESPLLTRSSSCQCRKLNLWMQTFITSYNNLSCEVATFWDNVLWECDLSFADMKDLRADCGDVSKLPLPYRDVYKWHRFFVRFFFPFFLFLLVFIWILLKHEKHRKIYEAELSAAEDVVGEDSTITEENLEE